MKFFYLLFFVSFIFFRAYSKDSDVADINTKEQLEEVDDNQIDKKNDSEVDVVEEYEGESIVSGKTYDVGQTILNLTNVNDINLPFYDGIDNNVILSQSMLNTQQETGDPLFILLSRQSGLLKDNYLYLGGMASFNPAWNISNNGNSNSINNYALEYYMLSTLGDWTSVFASLNIFTTNGQWNVTPGGIYFILGNLDRFPVYSYAALSTVNFGNFDETTNFLPTLTRLFFMQSGGNVNLSYNHNGLQANFVFLAPSSNDFLQVANAYNGNAQLGFSLNMKYTQDLNTTGDYWYFGAAYSNVSGFTNNNNDNVGVIDFNFGMNINKLEFINEFIFTDKGVNKTTDVSGAFNLRESFATSIFPDLKSPNFLSNGGNIYSWSSQLDYTIDLYNKDFVPFVSYSQIQQSSSNYASSISSGFRYNVFADGWLGLSYSYIDAQASDLNEKDNLLALYLRIFI